MRDAPNRQDMLMMLPTKRFIPAVFSAMAAISLAAAAQAAPAPHADSPALPGNLHAFFEAYCFDCHGDSEQKGNLRLDTLSPDFSDPALAREWIEVFDRLSTGRMPPKKKPRPPAAQVQQTVDYRKYAITTAE